MVTLFFLILMPCCTLVILKSWKQGQTQVLYCSRPLHINILISEVKAGKFIEHWGNPSRCVGLSRKKDGQKKLDDVIVKGLAADMKSYLKSRFSLTANMYPHELKFWAFMAHRGFRRQMGGLARKGWDWSLGWFALFFSFWESIRGRSEGEYFEVPITKSTAEQHTSTSSISISWSSVYSINT